MMQGPTSSDLAELFIRGFKPIDEAVRTKLIEQIQSAYRSFSELDSSSEPVLDWKVLQLLGLLKSTAVTAFIKPDFCGQFMAVMTCKQDLIELNQLSWYFALFEGEKDFYSDKFYYHYYPSLEEALKSVDDETNDL